NHARPSRRPGISNRNQITHRCRLTIPSYAPYVLNLAAEISAPVRRVRRFHPPIRARNLVGGGGGESAIGANGVPALLRSVRRAAEQGRAAAPRISTWNRHE